MARSIYSFRLTGLVLGLLFSWLLVACTDSGTTLSLSLEETTPSATVPVATLTPDTTPALTLRPAVTTPPGRASDIDTMVTYTFDTDLPQKDREQIKQGISLARKAFGSTQTFKVLANHAAAKNQPNDGVQAVSGPGLIIIFVYSQVWKDTPEWERIMTMVHEYYHVEQYRLSQSSSLSFYSANPSPLEPFWLVEGSAEYLAYRTVSEAGLLSYQQARADLVKRSRQQPFQLKTLEARTIDKDLVMDPYVIGTLGAEYLLKNYGGQAALNTYWELLSTSKRDDAFKGAFKVALSEFYHKFEQARLQDFPSDLPVGTLPLPNFKVPLAINFVGTLDTGILPGSQPQAKAYLFTVSGVNLLTLSYDNFQQALALPDEINNWAFLGGNCIAVYFTPQASPGRYNFSLNLPDGRSAKVVFQYPTTQKVKLATP